VLLAIVTTVTTTARYRSENLDQAMLGDLFATENTKSASGAS
jgi:hypothetical protein